jgi:hypothetical protein
VNKDRYTQAQVIEAIQAARGIKAAFIRPYQTAQETDTRFIPSTVDDNCFVNREYTATLDSLTGWQKRAWRCGLLACPGAPAPNHVAKRPESWRGQD